MKKSWLFARLIIQKPVQKNVSYILNYRNYHKKTTKNLKSVNLTFVINCTCNYTVFM